MKRASWNMLLAGMVLMTGAPAMASRPADVQHSLAEVRDRLKAGGCDRFILVQAFMDELLPDNQPYKLTYTGDNIMINDVPLGEPYRSAYLTMLKDFFAEKQGPNGGRVGFFSITSDEKDLSAAALLAPSYAKAACPCDKEAQAMKVIVKHGAGAGPARTTAGKGTSAPARRIVYNKDGITVDGRKLSAGEEAQYKQLYFNHVTTAPQGKESVIVTGSR